MSLDESYLRFSVARKGGPRLGCCRARLIDLRMYLRAVRRIPQA